MKNLLLTVVILASTAVAAYAADCCGLGLACCQVPQSCCGAAKK